MIWNIITDSSCDLHKYEFSDENNTIRYYSVPFVITAGGKDFVDDDNLDLENMLTTMENDKKASFTACPSPASWQELFELEGNVIAITISKELSGSFNSACVAKDMILEEQPDKNIAIINSISAGSGLVIIMNTICNSIKNGMSFEDVINAGQNCCTEKRTIFALSSFDNLVKNGRMSPIVGFLAGKLKFWGIGVASEIGTIIIKGKAHGSRKALRAIIDDMVEYGKPIKNVVISHCQNSTMVEALKSEILTHWENICVEIHDTKGLCSYYAERHGLIVAYE